MQERSTGWIRVAGITSGRDTPSARYRVRQYVPDLEKAGVRVREYVPWIEKYSSMPHPAHRLLRRRGVDTAAAWRRLKRLSRVPGLVGSRFADVTWLERILVPLHETYELRYKRPIVFDFDDAIWLNEGREGVAERVVAGCDRVVAGNSYLAAWARQHNPEVSVIPTSVDTRTMRPVEEHGRASSVKEIGWIGTSSNLPFLQGIEPALAKALDAVAEARLVVVSDRPPEFASLPEGRVRFVRWRPGIAEEELPKWAMGLMPLEDSEWARGKCAFKLLQYMAAGIPACFSPWGVAGELAERAEIGRACRSLGDWEEAMVELLRDSDARAVLGAEGRRLCEDEYSTERNALRYVELFCSMADREEAGS